MGRESQLKRVRRCELCAEEFLSDARGLVNHVKVCDGVDLLAIETPPEPESEIETGVGDAAG